MLLKVLKTLYSIITVFCLFYGVPLAIINANKEGFVAYLIMALVGVALLLLAAVYILMSKKKKSE